MISLRKHIETYQDTSRELSLAAYRSSLLAMADCGKRATPKLGEELNLKLREIEETLGGPVTPDVLNASRDEVSAELSQWADRVLAHHNENEREMKEIIAAVAKAAESVSDRDEKYALQIGDLTGELRSVADISDLPLIRRSILESAKALQACVEKMVEDGRQSLERLTSEVVEYRTRLEESERVSALDSLTALANRRAFESHLEARIRAGKAFSLILIDLNDFKWVNDRFGHLAGDDLLKQFATELQSQFPRGDMVARWGGDEFAAIVSGPLASADARVERIRRWALGEYKLGSSKVPLKASIAAVEWDRSETGMELLARADKFVYKAKEAKKVPASR